MTAPCDLHGKYSTYLYVKSTGAKLCLGCMKAGLYKQYIVDEAKLVYPQYFKEENANE